MKSVSATMQRFFRRNWFSFALLVTILIGLIGYQQLAWLTDILLLRYSIVFSVMFVMAWSLELGHVWNSCRRPLSPILASLLNMVLIPLLAWPLSKFFPQALALGIIATAVTPCTLATAAVWTRRAGGNEVAAIMTTLLTNATCFLVTPLWLSLLAHDAEFANGANFVYDMMFKLLVLVVLPMVLAQLTRANRKTAQWATEKKLLLGIYAQVGVLLMVLIGSVQMGMTLAERSEPQLGYWLVVVGIAMAVLHFVVLYHGIALAKLLGREPADQIAVGIAGSQKTFMVGLTICLELNASILPLLLFHTIQLIGDAQVAEWFRRKNPCLNSPGNDTKSVE